MCLSTVKRTYAGKGRTVYTCYKVFDKKWRPFGTLHRLHFQWFSLNKSMVVPIDKWIEAELSVVGSIVNRYNSGFHCYTTRKDANRCTLGGEKVVQIKARGLLAIGTQNEKPVLVFREMFVPHQR